MGSEVPLFDPSRKYVRVTGERNGIIEFEFGIGDLSLAVELMLPPDAFADFCAANAVTLVVAEAGPCASEGLSGDDAERAMSWRPSDVQRQL